MIKFSAMFYKTLQPKLKIYSINILASKQNYLGKYTRIQEPILRLGNLRNNSSAAVGECVFQSTRK
jgi:hypothetical protein